MAARIMALLRLAVPLAAAAAAPAGDVAEPVAAVAAASSPPPAPAAPALAVGRLRGSVDQAENRSLAEAGGLEVSSFFWNTHWQCSVAAKGASAACKDIATRRFVELAREAGADIVASVELTHGMTKPVHLPSNGLEDWSQVDGPCPRSDGSGGGDAAALAFAPGWRVIERGGGCLRHDWDTRAFAVARVEPPAPVRGCSSLCVVAIHTPHTQITTGRPEVERVCGGQHQQCTIAMGDWNTDAGGVAGHWSSLIGGDGPNHVVPNERSCCWPEEHHFGIFDHLASSIPETRSSLAELLPYQFLGENPVEQHRPVAVRVVLPLA